VARGHLEGVELAGYCRRISARHHARRRRGRVRRPSTPSGGLETPPCTALFSRDAASMHRDDHFRGGDRCAINQWRDGPCVRPSFLAGECHRPIFVEVTLHLKAARSARRLYARTARSTISPSVTCVSAAFLRRMAATSASRSTLTRSRVATARRSYGRGATARDVNRSVPRSCWV
jgi:hypothetical protein